MSSNLSQPVFYDNLEAAPTPTVPGGPRRDRATVFPPQPAHAAPVSPVAQRRNSIKSSKSHTGKKKKNDKVAWDTTMPVNASTWSGRRSSKQVQPTPAFLRSRNTSPIRQFSEPLMAHRMETDTSAKDAAKDRPGFFRRVFGSSRAPAPALSESQAPQTRGGTRANSRDGFASPYKLSKPPPDDTSHPPTEAVQPPLVKKPSSFFRRRKKSVSERMPPPILPLHLQSNYQNTIDPAPRSPTSSLRQVMNPYLENPMRSDARQFAGTYEYDSTSLQTHTLQAKGSADAVHQDYDTRQDAGFNNPLRQPRDVASPRRETVTERLHLKFNERTSSKAYENSFFHDDSSNETRLPGVADDHGLSRHDTVRLDQPPTSAPADMKFGKENLKRESKSREGAEPLNQRSLDSPRDRSALSTLNSNVPVSPRPSTSMPVKAEAKVSNQPSASGTSKDSERVWLQSSNSDEELRKSDITLPTDRTEVSPVSDYQSAHSTLLAPKPNDDIHSPETTVEDVAHKLSVDADPTQPAEADRVQSKQLYDGDESLAPKSMAAAWLGEPGPERTRIRQAYMELFEWQNLNILAALRGLCGRLYLKGEAQQVDRILDAFSTRWCACNPNHGFKASGRWILNSFWSIADIPADVVHTICYSVLLLNTDLHQAEIETKMTRQQFLKNILPTIRRVVTDAAPDAFTNARASTLPPARPWADSSRANVKSTTFHEAPEPRRSFEGQRPVYRLSQRPSDQTVYTSTPPQSPLDFNSSLGDTGPLVKTPFHGKLSTWENQVEIVLKDFYNSIRLQPLPLYGTENKEPTPETSQPSNSLSAMTSSMLRRTPSVLSKAGSENMSYSRGRGSENRLGTGKWQSKNRSRPRLYPASTVASSRRSSFDEQSSVTSPSITSAWSRFSSFGKTQTSLSVDSFANNYPHGDFKQSIGFANALSQAIIREEGAGTEEETLRAAPLLEDESLELAGAPWAKEGMVKHKYHLEAVEKRAKDRNWVDSFAVIEKGYMRLFSFSMDTKSLRRKAKSQKASGGVVGGGNWADSAETLGTFLLRHTIASALPPPGYSKTRPHVWALSLPTGAVHLFQVGTPEIVKEFVTTANYWSARLSKEPMVGGISNIEYGWSDSVINVSLLNTERNMSSSAITSPAATRPSLQSSIRSTRSSIDQGVYRARLPGDRVVITDWAPPQQSLVASVLMEVDQLKGLLTYVKNITEELEKHNELRAAMLLAVSPHLPPITNIVADLIYSSRPAIQTLQKQCRTGSANRRTSFARL